MAATRRRGGSARRPRRGKKREWTNAHAAIVIAAMLAVVIAMTVLTIIREDRFHKQRDTWTALPWNPSWPVLEVEGPLRSDVARAIYSFAGNEPDVLRYIPCYCGCVRERHRSNHDCYVTRRSSGSGVLEWNSHGLSCPVGPDITGDVMLWHEQGTPLSTIRQNIEREFSSRGPATPTPAVPSH